MEFKKIPPVASAQGVKAERFTQDDRSREPHAMTLHRTMPAVVLLVALTLFVGVPTSVLAVEGPPEIATSIGDGSGQASQPIELAEENGDPDDWASRSDDATAVGGSTGVGAGGCDGKWSNYLEYLRRLVAKIKLHLTGIL